MVIFARVLELVYRIDLKSIALTGLRVRLPPRAPKNHSDMIGVIFNFFSYSAFSSVFSAATSS